MKPMIHVGVALSSTAWAIAAWGDEPQAVVTRLAEVRLCARMAIDVSASALVAAASCIPAATSPSGNANPTTLVWSIKHSGEIRWVRSLPAPPDGGVALLDGIVLTPEGDTLLVRTVGGAGRQLFRVGEDGTVALQGRVNVPGEESFSLVRVRAAGQRQLLLVGQSEDGGSAYQVDETGRAIWRYGSNQGRSEVFVDGLATVTGGRILVGNFGDYMNPMGGSTVSVRHVDALGGVQRSVSWPGRNGAIRATSSGGYFVAYDASSDGRTNLWARHLDPALQTASPVRLPGAAPHDQVCGIAGSDESTIITAVVDGRLSLIGVEAKGAAARQYWSAPANVLRCISANTATAFSILVLELEVSPLPRSVLIVRRFTHE